MKIAAIKRILFFSALFIFFIFLVSAYLSIFFDQAVLVRKDTIYHIRSCEKVVALTFDDGPSAAWTPKILDELKKAGVKATFFMLGEHVKQYPDVARRVAAEGHEIANHTYDHQMLLFDKPDKLKEEIIRAEKEIRDVTGVRARYFRPPKAWLTEKEKKQVRKLGYETVLWSLNSKDWVTFHDKQITSYILRHVRPGDIILFHDSGGVFSHQGGNREETVRTIPRLVEKLKEKGYRFVTISELLKLKEPG